MNLPRVLIFTPTYSGKDYCLKDFLANVKTFTYPNVTHVIIDTSTDESYLQVLKDATKGTAIEVVAVGRGGSSRECIARAQNYARKRAIDEGFDYLLSLESDIFPQHNIVERLIINAKKVITGLYFIGTPDKKVLVPCATKLDFKPEIGLLGTRLVGITNDNKLDPVEIAEFVKPGVEQVAAGGMGCCLIHRDVFTVIPFMYEPKMNGHSDIFWFNECHRRKIPVYVDKVAFCEHRYSDWKEVKDR